jgi:hypothetical protein
MSRLNLGLDSRKVFGEYLPSVFIQNVVISNPLNPVTGIPNIEGTTNINVMCDITFDKPADTNMDMAEWVTNQYSDLYLYAYLSPFESLNTDLEDSNLDMQELVSVMSYVSPSSFESSWPGFDYVISYMKEFFINDWIEGSAYCEGTNPDGTAWTDSDRRAGLGDLESEIARRFYGPADDESQPLETEGPWSAASMGFIQENIEEFLNFISPMSSTPTTWSAPEAAWGIKKFMIPLSDLVAGAGPYPGSSIVTEGYYDSEGNEIIKIGNIGLPFEYNTETNPTGITPRLSNTKKLFLVCAVGRPVVYYPPSFSKSLFNYNFGDISYEHILENNAVPDQTEIVFREIKSSEVFNGKPIQTFDRKYFVPHPVNQKGIVESLENLMKNFNKWTTKDKRLERNVVSLKALLASKSKSTDLLLELKQYSIAYPHKDYGSIPGKFFKAFQQVVNSFNETVSKQLQLAKNLAYNVTVIDKRPPPLKNIYDPPGDRALVRMSSEDFIPSPWQLMSRYVEQTLPVKGLLTDFVEFAMGEGFGIPWEVPSSTGMTDVGTDVMPERAYDAWEYYTSSAGYSNLSDAELYADTVVTNKGVWFFDYEKALHSESLISKVFNVRKIQDLFHYTVPYEYYFCRAAQQYRAEADLTLQNEAPVEGDGYTGHIPESVHEVTLSSILWDIGDPAPMSPQSKYFRYQYDPDNLKYGQPYVYTFEKMGFEAAGASGMVETWHGSEWSDIPGSTFTTSATDRPWADRPTSAGQVSDPEREMFLGSVSDSDVGWEIMKDFMLWVDDSDGPSGESFRTLSYLRYVCFDLLNPTYAERLEGFGNYDLSSFRTENPYGPRDGYRMLAFQYRDYMDDDVAYYNTWGSFYGGRNGEYIAQIMGTEGEEPLPGAVEDWTEDHTSGVYAEVLNDVWTSYEYFVLIQDRTIEVYDDIYNMASGAFEEMEKYAQLSRELCSYNNITGSFNTFFTEGIDKYYGDSTKPWITAVYMYNALRELIYASFSSSSDNATNMEALLEDCRRISNDIGPVNGTVANINSFVEKFRLVLHNFYPQDGLSEGGALARQAWAKEPHAGDSSYWDEDPHLMIAHLKTIWEGTPQTFSNKVKITKMIYGNLNLAAYWEDGFMDYNPPTCADLIAHPDASDAERVMAWLSCVSKYYKTDLKTWCITAVGGEDVYKDFSARPAWKIYRWTIMAVAFLYEFEDMISEYYYGRRHSASGWYESRYDDDPFYNRAGFEEFFSSSPFDLDTLSPYTSSSTTWMQIISEGMFFLRRFNDYPTYGTLEDTWIPGSAWTGYGTHGRVEPLNPWEITYVEVSTDWIDEYGDTVGTPPDDPDVWEDVGRMTAFYWLKFEIDMGYYGEDSSTRLWTTDSGEFLGHMYDSPESGPQGRWEMTRMYSPVSSDGTEGDSARYVSYIWQDQFQFDLGLVQWDAMAEKMKLDGVHMSPL